LLGPGEPFDVTDLGDEHRPQQRPDPGNGLDGQVAGVGAQPAADELGVQVPMSDLFSRHHLP
jgi:hypothetical protein